MKKIIIVTFSVLYAASAHGATEEEEIKALKTYCESDVERLCKGVEYGGGRIKACLKQNEKEISVGCAQALKALKDG